MHRNRHVWINRFTSSRKILCSAMQIYYRYSKGMKLIKKSSVPWNTAKVNFNETNIDSSNRRKVNKDRFRKHEKDVNIYSLIS